MQTVLPGSYRLSHFGRLSLIGLMLLTAWGWAMTARLSPGMAGSASTSDVTKINPATALTPARPTASLSQQASSQLPAGLYPTLIHQEQTEGGPAYVLSRQSTSPTDPNWRADNPAHHLSLDFTPTGVNINDWKLELTAFGDEGVVQPLVSTGPANRVEYRHTTGLTEWYVNGPLGLEQGFTLARPLPQTDSDGWLNLPVTFKGASLQASAQNKDWLKLVGPSGNNLGQYGKLYASDATGQVLESHLETGERAGQAWLRVKLSGASYPVVIDPFIQQAELTASDGASNDSFGYAVALSGDGNTALVGAFQKTVGTSANQGAAYIFTRSNNTWTQQQRLTASDGAASDFFGVSVALSGDGSTALVGAYGKTIGANSQQGAAYVFTRSGATWTQQQRFTASDGADSDYFGYAVSLSSAGNTAVIGAYGKTIGANTGQGAAYIFTQSGAAWSQQRLTASDGATTDTFGYAVALSGDGNTVLVGAYGKTIGANTGQGAAYIFSRSGAAWAQQPRLVASDGADSDGFGVAVALDSNGDTALVGAFQKIVGSNANQGSAYIFILAGATWSQQQEITASDGAASDSFGISAALSGDGNTALVGANFKKIGSNFGQGAAYTYSRSGNTWAQQLRLTASDGADSDYFGYALALSSDGTVAIVGAYSKQIGANTGQGAAYLFAPQPTTTSLTSNPNPSLVGQSVSFTATLSPAAASGVVSFTEGATVLGTGSLAGGVATFSTNLLSAGSHLVTAMYGGNSTYASSSSQVVTQVVNLNSSTTSLVSSLNPSGVGQSVTFTATVSPAAASGIVSFTVDGGTAIPVTLSGGLATYTTNTLAAGSHNIGATYGGNSTYAGSNASLTQLVGLNQSTISLTSHPDPSVISQPVTFTASVSPVAATGTVTFTEGATVLGTASLVNGTATYITTGLSIGSHVITATYGGNANYAGATSQPYTQVVQSACQPLVVTSITDDGSGTTCGTLSYALTQPVSGSTPVTITFALIQGNTITFTGSLAATAKVKANVTLYGGAFGSPARIIVNGNGASGDGLHLLGHNYLVNLTLKNFGGRELVLEGTDNHFQGLIIMAG